MNKRLLHYFTLLLFLGISMAAKAQVCDADTYEFPMYFDTYHEHAQDESSWTMYNVHDPSMIKEGDWYYLYCTDVAWGQEMPHGIMVRKSQDLINWEYLGTAFEGTLAGATSWIESLYETGKTNSTESNLWAPYIMKVGDQFRMYYSIPSAPAGIVLATSTSPEGPWTHAGGIVGGYIDDAQINFIDPTVVIDQENGEYWMIYGSYQTGMYCVQLDPETGLKHSSETGYGKKVAARSGNRHAAIEGPEVIYHDGYYYIFVSYDWLGDDYNVRVGRASSPDGPYYDINGVDMSTYADNSPMILAPYRFKDHMGWQGTGHCGVYNDNGTFYLFHQGRPLTSPANMVLHMRELYWLNGWPVVSPERYTEIPQCDISADELIGDWEHLLLLYDFHSTTEVTDVNESGAIELRADGTIDGNSANTWSYADGLLTMSWVSGTYIDQVIVKRAWDWELRCPTIVYTGMNAGGLCMWGKKVNATVREWRNTVIDGATYVIRVHESNKVLTLNGTDATGNNILQQSYTGKEQQKWTIYDNGDGYHYLSPVSSTSGKYMEVTSGSAADGANIQLGSSTVANKNLFKFSYQDNGYFNILTKVSSDASAIDLWAFSSDENANFHQWTFGGGNNQLFRLERVDVDGYTSAPSIEELKSKITVYSTTAKDIVVKLDGPFITDNVQIKIYNLSGRLISSKEANYEWTVNCGHSFSSGMYIVTVTKGGLFTTEKVIVK